MARKKKGGGGHHGGAWKVAYADFVTAMMAFFMVLWILGMTEPETKAMISAYFNDPLVFLKAKDAKGLEAIIMQMQNIRPEPPKNKPPTSTSVFDKRKGMGVDEKKLFKDLKENLEKSLKAIPEFKEISKNIIIDMTIEGMRIELAEDKNSQFFSPGRGEINPPLRKIISEMGKMLNKLPNKMIVEGHTDSVPTSNSKMSNWELSTERANSARRVLDEAGLSDQIFAVRGYAANVPLVPEDPTQSANRRISMVVLYSGMEKKLTQLETKKDDGTLDPNKFETTSGSDSEGVHQSVPTPMQDGDPEKTQEGSPDRSPEKVPGRAPEKSPPKVPDPKMIKIPDPFKNMEKKPEKKKTK